MGDYAKVNRVRERIETPLREASVSEPDVGIIALVVGLDGEVALGAHRLDKEETLRVLAMTVQQLTVKHMRTVDGEGP